MIHHEISFQTHEKVLSNRVNSRPEKVSENTCGGKENLAKIGSKGHLQENDLLDLHNRWACLHHQH